MTDLQLVCLFALEEMTLVELNRRYFENGGIGYTRRVIAGDANPHPIMTNSYIKGFEGKYIARLTKYRQVEESQKGKW